MADYQLPFFFFLEKDNFNDINKIITRMMAFFSNSNYENILRPTIIKLDIVKIPN